MIKNKITLTIIAVAVIFWIASLFVGVTLIMWDSYNSSKDHLEKIDTYNSKCQELGYDRYEEKYYRSRTEYFCISESNGIQTKEIIITDLDKFIKSNTTQVVKLK